MIFVTGDTHGTYDIHKLRRLKICPDAKYLIICGDFGFIWDKEPSPSERWWLDWLDQKPYTTLFVDGNHENHDRLDAMEVTTWHGGKIHQISPKVIHLMRGQVYDIEGKTFFTMGGASSIDRIYRKEGISWWAREMPSQSEYKEARKNLAARDNKVNYIITHTAPQHLIPLLGISAKADELSSFLEEISQNVQFDHWYFGHFHQDRPLGGKYTALYDSVEVLDSEFTIG